MATLLEQCSVKEMCAVLLFLNARNALATEIHCQHVEVHGEYVVNEERVAKMVSGILMWRSEYGRLW
jgi:phage host-nuclease inhibitor protein Gam